MLEQQLLSWTMLLQICCRASCDGLAVRSTGRNCTILLVSDLRGMRTRACFSCPEWTESNSVREGQFRSRDGGSIGNSQTHHIAPWARKPDTRQLAPAIQSQRHYLKSPGLSVTQWKSNLVDSRAPGILHQPRKW